MEYLAHSLFARPVVGLLNEQSFSDQFRELLDLDGLHDDFVGLKDDRLHRAFHVREAAQQHRQCGWLGVSHGRDHGEAIPCIRHVQVGDQHIKFLGGNALQSVRYATCSDHLESLGLERSAHHLPHNIVVINQKDPMNSLSFV
jgi:hypothetical protein